MARSIAQKAYSAFRRLQAQDMWDAEYCEHYGMVGSYCSDCGNSNAHRGSWQHFKEEVAWYANNFDVDDDDEENSDVWRLDLSANEVREFIRHVQKQFAIEAGR